MEIPKLYQPLTGSQYKIYVLTDGSNVQYIGTSKQSIRARLSAGLNAKKYAYQWKKLSSVCLSVWCFTELDKTQIENIEAELAFIVRQKTGEWPLGQNEIHFNNEYAEGKQMAEKLYQQLKKLSMLSEN
ncbi:MAG: hypothetical protein JKX84_00545 [Flavobacteriales bacterium]|nr:hypothetical protein [Flavobacteriales bacterium]